MKKDIILNVDKQDYLLSYLKDNVVSKSKNNLKTLLKKGNVFVNGNKTFKHDLLLSKNDQVLIKLNKTKIESHQSDIDILYEDDNLIAINKPSGLLTISEKDDVKSAFSLVQEHLKKINKNNKLYSIHRLDKDTSGIVMFSKNIESKKSYQTNWSDIVVKRNYIAVCEKGNINKGRLEHLINEDNNKVQITKDNKKGKLAVTEYKVLRKTKEFMILDIEILTGRKNQIRAQMSHIGFPIIGDSKYGGKHFKKMLLHANELIFKDPFNKNIVKIESKTPSYFHEVIK